MEQIAADQLHSSYFKPDGSTYDRFFDELTSVAWGKAENQEQWDLVYLNIIRKNWQRK